MLTWSLEGDDSGDFTISSDGKLTFNAVPDYEAPADTGTDNVYNVTVKVADDEGTPTSATLAVTITVTDVNEKPTIDTTDNPYNFAENTLIATAVATFEATDPDSGFDLTWTLTGDDADDFEITENTDQDGLLKFKD